MACQGRAVRVTFQTWSHPFLHVAASAPVRCRVFLPSNLRDGQPGDMTRFAVEPSPALAVRRAGARLVRGLLADAAVDPLPEQIGVAEVAGVLLDHVEYHLAQRDGRAVLHRAADGEVG